MNPRSPVRGVGAEGGSSGAGTMSCRASGPGMRRAGCATAVAGFRLRGSGTNRQRVCDALLSGYGSRAPATIREAPGRAPALEMDVLSRRGPADKQAGPAIGVPPRCGLVQG